MEPRRTGGPGLIIGGGTGIGLATLGAFGAALGGWIPWAAPPVAWLGGNASLVLVALWRARPAAREDRAQNRRPAGRPLGR